MDGWDYSRALQVLGDCYLADYINLEGLDFDLETLKGILQVDPSLWTSELDGIKEFYAQCGDKLPAKLREELDGLAARLK